MTTKHIFPIANFILITFMCYLGVKGFYQVITSTQPAPQSIVTQKAPSLSFENEKVQTLSYYDKIKERNLLKTGKPVEVKVDEKKVDLGKVALTDLNLKLWGTITGNEKTARAVIEETKERKQNLYRVGDKIQSAIVKMILREEVILSVNGKDEKLTMEKDAKPGRGRTSSPIAGSTGRSSTIRSQKISLKRSQIEDAMANVTELMGQIKVRPHFKDGVPNGLALSSIKSRSIFRKMGLRNGDIITGIDGNPIETMDDALKFYQNMMSASSVSVQINRRNKEKNIEYTIR
ncbi:MAG: PDZ domain-containing protein [Desulfobacula sp.]|nr:PDZ domain-containing protein [Desulfobacula sp.]